MPLKVHPNIFLRYSFAIGVVAIAALLTRLLWPFLKDSPFLLFVAAAALSAWLGGLIPGLLTTVLSIVVANYFLIEPLTSIFSSQGNVFQLAVFALVTVLINGLNEARRRSEEGLAASRDQLRIILEGVADGIVAQDPTGQPVFANENAAKVLGFSSVAQLIQTSISQSQNQYTLHDEDGHLIPTSDLPVHRVFRQGKAAEITAQLRNSGTGRTNWVTVRAQPVFNAGGQVTMAINIIRDISQAKRHEGRLREERERFEITLRGISDAVIVTDPSGNIQFMNPAAETLTGWPESEALGQPYEEIITLIHEHSFEKVTNPLKTVLEQGRFVNAVDRIVAVTREGEEKIVEASSAPLRNAAANIVGAVLVIRDVTDRRQAERDLAALTQSISFQRQRLRNIIANVPGVVWEAFGPPDDSDQKIDFVSDYAQSLLGYPVEEWLNTPNFWLTIVHSDDRDRVAEESRAIFETGGEGVVQFRWLARDGRLVHVEAHSTVIADQENRPVGMRGVTMDITERKQAEAALEIYARELKQSNEELQQFAYVASHDLQEPLRTVTSYLQLIEERYRDQLDQDANDFIDFAVDGASRMRMLIQSLLAYSRIDTHAKAFERIDCQQILDSILENLRSKIEESGAKITMDPMPEMIADSVQLTQLFQNLIGNAIKFCGERTPEIHIGVQRENNVWRFSVKDNGIGIDNKYLDRIFEVFQRLHTRDGYEGTGIGLAICRKVVERHGGFIWVESEVGQGTTFYFTIPVKPRDRRHEYASYAS